MAWLWCLAVLSWLPQVAGAKPVGYEIRIDMAPAAIVGERHTLSLQINPAPKRSISTDGPLKVSLSVAPATGLTLEKTILRRADATPNEAGAATGVHFAVGFTAIKPGRYQLDLDIRFWLCGRRTCRPVREHRQVEITIALREL